MPDTTTAERPPTRDEMRILRHYADGQQIKHIVAIVGLDTEAVRAVIDEWTGFTRQRAKEVVRRWWLVGEQQPEVNPSAEPPPAHRKSTPPTEPTPEPPPAEPRPARYCDCGLADIPANVGLHRPHCSRSRAATTPEPAVKAKRAPRRPAATEVPLPLELILVRAVKAGGEHSRRAGQLRQQILDLGAELDDLERVAAQRKRVEELRHQLDAEEAKLRELASPGAPKQEEATA